MTHVLGHLAWLREDPVSGRVIQVRRLAAPEDVELLITAISALTEASRQGLSIADLAREAAAQGEQTEFQRHLAGEV